MKSRRQARSLQNASRWPRARAQAELRNTTRDEIAAAITDFVEWRAFAYWFRLIHEHRGGDSCQLERILAERCPGFAEGEAAYREAHPGESEFRWLRLIEWIDSHVFRRADAQGWRHALGYYAARDERLDRTRAYWLECDEAWKHKAPDRYPEFEEWRGAALAVR
jgi:hypothetical protein